ncbi:MAG: LLM class flavin-dependent oxidoreductase [Actinomycetota bacterium]
MDLGVSVSSTHRANGPRVMIERTAAAYAAGFSSLTIGDHHSMPVPYAQNTPMLGRLLAEWPDRPAGCLFLVPLWHPLLMAEHIGTLAATHNDRFIVQTGIGGGADQFAAFGADLGTRGVVLEEAVDAIKALLAGETVTAERFDMTDARVGLLPPEPVEWWISAGVDRALERAARIGDAWYAEPSLTAEAAKEKIAHYRNAGGTRAIVRKDALVLADGDRARQLGQEQVERGYRGMRGEALLIGGPDDVAADLQELADVGFDSVIIRCMSVPQDLALETLSLLGPLSGT